MTNPEDTGAPIGEARELRALIEQFIKDLDMRPTRLLAMELRNRLDAADATRPAPSAPAVAPVSDEEVKAALLASDRTTTRLYHDTEGTTVRKAAMRAALVAFCAGRKP